MHHCGYCEEIFSPEELRLNAVKLSELIEKYMPEGKALACSGNSSVIMASAISFWTGMPIILVRKSGELTHSDLTVEFDEELIVPNSKFIFVDDFMSSGRTARHVKYSIEELPDYNFSLLGFAFYHEPNRVEFSERGLDRAFYPVVYSQTFHSKSSLNS